MDPRYLGIIKHTNITILEVYSDFPFSLVKVIHKNTSYEGYLIPVDNFVQVVLDRIRPQLSLPKFNYLYFYLNSQKVLLLQDFKPITKEQVIQEVVLCRFFGLEVQPSNIYSNTVIGNMKVVGDIPTDMKIWSMLDVKPFSYKEKMQELLGITSSNFHIVLNLISVALLVEECRYSALKGEYYNIRGRIGGLVP